MHTPLIHLSIASPGRPRGIWPLRFTCGWGIWPWGGFRGWGTLTGGGAHRQSVLWSACGLLTDSVNRVVQIYWVFPAPGWGCLTFSSGPRVGFWDRFDPHKSPPSPERGTLGHAIDRCINAYAPKSDVFRLSLRLDLLFGCRSMWYMETM